MPRRVALAVLAALLAAGCAAPAASAPPAELVVVAAHPDDEVLAAAGLIWNATQHGLRVRVILLTVGDGYPAALEAHRRSANPEAGARDLGEARHRESLAAAQRLGLSPEDLVFLAFPDELLLSLWREPDRVWTSPFTGASAVPYAFAHAPGAPHTGRELTRLLAEILREERPRRVVAMHPLDSHADHRAGAHFTHAAMDAAGVDAEVWASLVHFTRPAPWVGGEYQEESDWVATGSNFLAPVYVTPEGVQHVLDGLTTRALPPDLDMAGKRHALEAHATQMAVDGPLLAHFVKPVEAFWHDPFASGDPALAATIAEAQGSDVGALRPT